MNLINTLQNSYPNLNSYLTQKINEQIKNLKEEDKNFVPAHEWWKLEDIDNADYSDKISEGLKYFDLTDYCYALLENRNIEEFTQLMNTIEKYLKNCSQKEKNTIEVFFFESLINMISSHDMYELFYSLLGPRSRELCDENNKFWIKVEEIIKDENNKHIFNL